jgi:hypothetical protein
VDGVEVRQHDGAKPFDRAPIWCAVHRTLIPLNRRFYSAGNMRTLLN